MLAAHRCTSFRSMSLVLGLMFAQPAGPTWTGGSGAPQASAPAVVLPFAPTRGNLVAVRGAIGHIDDLQFLVDTGTSRTVIDARIARELHLRGDPDVLSAFGQTLSAERVVLPEMRLGSIRAKLPSVLAADLSETVSLVGLRLDAIVGIDVLRGHCVVVNYRARQLAFTCRTRWRASEPFNPDVLLPVVKARIDGRNHRLLVDTGADVLALFERAVARHGVKQPLEDVGVASLARSMRLRGFTPTSVRIGPRRLRFPPVLVLPDSDDDLGFDGILPVSALAPQVQIDLNRMAISW